MLIDSKNKMLNGSFVVGIEGVHVTMEGAKVTSVTKNLKGSIWICYDPGFAGLCILSWRRKQRIQRKLQISGNGKTGIEITDVFVVGVTGLQEGRIWWRF